MIIYLSIILGINNRELKDEVSTQTTKRLKFGRWQVRNRRQLVELRVTKGKIEATNQNVEYIKDQLTSSEQLSKESSKTPIYS